jgi:4-alpha-glucanotransferase
VTEERRVLRQLAHLYDVQESYVNVHGTRIRAGIDSTVAVLRAMGAPIASAQDAPAALRARRQELARRPVEPVIVAWNGHLRDVDVRIPVARRQGTVRFALTEEGAEPAEWDEAAATETDTPEEGSVPARLAVRRRLPIGRHTFWLDTGDVPASALVLSAPRRCPQPAGRWWGVFAPL